jgi:hypothetical protein
MKAQQLLNGGALIFQAATAKAAKEAFDSAWSAVAHQFAGDANATDKARVILAECVLERDEAKAKASSHKRADDQ